MKMKIFDVGFWSLGEDNEDNNLNSSYNLMIDIFISDQGGYSGISKNPEHLVEHLVEL